MPQFYLSSKPIDSKVITLRGEEAHHAKDVFRVKVGQRISLFDGAGTGFKGLISKISKDSIQIEIEAEFYEHKQNGPRFCLAQSVLPRDAMDWSIRKLTELGVDEIIPLLSERSVVRLDARRKKDKKEHWQRIALSASKQCGRLTLPVINDAVQTKRILKKLDDYDAVYFADTRDTAESFKEVISQNTLETNSKCLFVIGPEGGFSAEELAMLDEAGAKSVSFGADVLRSETAGVFVASVFHYLYG